MKANSKVASGQVILKPVGPLEIVVEDGGSLEIKSLKLVNEGWEFVELSDEEAAEVHARIARQPYSPEVRYGARADTALERSRARARDAKARLLSSELPLTDGLWRFDPVSTLHADPAVLYRLQEKDYSTAVWES